MKHNINPKTGRVVTSAGIEIGVAHQARPAPIGSHAEVIQAALLRPPTSQRAVAVRHLCRKAMRAAGRLAILVAGH